ncbi:PEBP-like protein [Dothidotthia symphoricarpi CBS 119687]|uniref:PEBP-like protein n=1 Tax=Dothidotthia symphoricarpi CBS 119687 TaxID=1392245 RepID=A0A6A5ZYP4_9PLEO|nr:PEBP-like protein [Dothidotthia symphoricarpi CBS 119687]KAF2124024.1 PEBP-like protein [Dothidotthia symphoricarpi CBS 119687]
MALNALVDSLKTADLLPSPVFPADFSPSATLSIAFPSKNIENGTLVRVSEVKQQPTLSISLSTPPAPSQAYTFMLIDPDAPTPADPKFAYWRHWVVSHIVPGTHADATQSGTTLTQYLAPGPKDESGPHRYLFLLFEEPEGFKLEKSDVGGEEFVDRRSFKVGEFVGRHGLRVVGVQWMRGVGDGWVGEE